MTGYKYELIEDLNINEIAKAIIDGEVFYSKLGDIEYHWNNGMLKVRKNKCDSIALGNILHKSFYRRVECGWTDNLNGTVENSVLCWVDDESKERKTALRMIKDISLYYFDSDNTDWRYATPLTNEEIQSFLDNAPKGVK